MNAVQWETFATKYTSAWCSQNPLSVAAFFAEDGVLQINNETPCIGGVAIAAAAQGFMTSFPDMVVVMNEIAALDNEHAVYHWTLTGTHTGPGGSGNPVCISGYEEWRIGADGLIAGSKGHFDTAEYERQLKGRAN